MEKVRNYKMISAYLSAEMYQKCKERHITWAHLIKMGYDSIDVQQKFNALMQSYNELEAKQRRTAELLNKYVAGDTNVLE